MKKLLIASILLVTLNVVLFFWLMPKPIGHCHMTTSEEITFYITGHGLGICLFLAAGLIALFIALLWKSSKGYLHKWKKSTLIIGIILNGFLLAFHSLSHTIRLADEDNIMNNKVYADLEGTSGDTSSIREGRFESFLGVVNRKGDQHSIEFSDGEVHEYRIEWLSDNEYMLYPLSNDTYLNGANSKGLITEINDEGYVVYHEICGLAQRQEWFFSIDN